MEDSITGRKTTRRTFLKTVGATSLVALAAPIIAGCAQEAPAAPTAAPAPAEPTKAPEAPAEATKAPEAPAEPTATPAPAAPTPTVSTQQPGQIKDVPRNRTLITPQNSREGKLINYDLWNPYCVGANHQDGSMILYEPLAYYSAFADKEILWLAESYQYSPDYKELTIKTRKGIKWSDGVPFSAADVAYTFESLKELGPKVRWGIDVQQFLESANAVDENTCVLKFKVPAPRFFAFATYKFDIGIYPVPKHKFEKNDWESYKAFDIAAGEPVTTSPWKLVAASQEQKIFDLREEPWWAVEQGLVKRKPKVERLLQIASPNLQAMQQAILANNIDFVGIHQPQSVKMLIEQNPKIIAHTGRDPNYGYVDWWPLSVYVNCSRPPYDKKEVRWAISYYLDRELIVDVAYDGYTSLWPWNMPSYPPLRPYIEDNMDIFERWNPLEYNPAKAEELLLSVGWTKGADGFWIDDTGKRASFEVLGYEWMGIVGPTVCEVLKRAGFDAEWMMPPDTIDRFAKGEYTASIYGHGGSVRDPYESLRLYQSATLAVPGYHQVNFPQWSNKEYDDIVDEVYVTPMEDTKKLNELFRKAMEVWLPEMPDIPLVEFYHNIALNETYWTNWPQGNPGDKTGVLPGPQNYCNEAYWHLTWSLILNELEPTQA